MEKVNRQLGLCIFALAVHVMTLLWYISGLSYPGVYWIGIESLLVAVVEIGLFMLSMKNYASAGVHWKTISLTVLSACSVWFSGYCFIIWRMFIL